MATQVQEEVTDHEHRQSFSMLGCQPAHRAGASPPNCHPTPAQPITAPPRTAPPILLRGALPAAAQPGSQEGRQAASPPHLAVIVARQVEHLPLLALKLQGITVKVANLWGAGWARQGFVRGAG